QVIFPINSTQTVQGSFLFSGVFGNRLTLRSSSAGTYAYLINSGTNTVTFVDVRDNNAGGGQTIQTNATSFDSGHNVNWFFGAASPASAPKRPIEIRGILLNGGTDVEIDWRAVTLDIAGNPTTIASYAVQRSTALFGTYATVSSVASGTTD